MAFSLFTTAREAFFLATHPALWFRRPLNVESLAPCPIEQFSRWYRGAQKGLSVEFPNAMCLSTVSPSGEADGRIVLLKEFDTRGFVFYTNSNSKKGSDIAESPSVALTFYWGATQQQVRIQGQAEVVNDEEADAYFAKRPRESQLGAWASHQSEILETRKDLEDRLESLRQEYEGQTVPRPPHWTGYRVVPTSIEFWQLRLSRLHDRFRYTRSTHTWEISRLNP